MQNLKLALGDTFAEPFRQALIYVNAFIIALTDIIRLFVNFKTSTGNPLPDGTIIGQVNDELDEFEEKQGLLSFDKFNVASSSTTTDLDITAALTEELNKQIELYEQIKNSMGEIQNEAIQIAQKIKDWVIVLDEEGKFKDFTDNIKTLFSLLTALITTAIITKLISLMTSLYSSFILAANGANLLAKSSAILQSTGLFILIYSITQLCLNFNELNEVQKLVYTTLIALGSAMVIFSNKTLLSKLVKSLSITKTTMLGLNQVALSTKLIFLGLGSAIGVLIGGILENFSSGVRLVAGALLLLTGVATAAAIAMGALQSTWSLGLAATGIVAGIIAITSAIKEANATGGLNFSGFFANGGIPRVGSMFIAGEAGAEFVTNMSNGQTGVTNIEQFKTAMLGALLDYNAIIGNNSAQNKMQLDINVYPREMARAINPYIKTENARGGNR